MRLLLRYLRQNKKILLLALVLAAINQGFSLLDPQIFRLIVDRYASRAAQLPHTEFLRGALFLLFAAIGVAFVSRVAKNFQEYYVNAIAQRVGTRLYGEALAHTFSLAFAVFEDTRSGVILQQMQKARADAQNLITSFINVIFLSTVSIVFVLIYAFTVHWSVGSAYFLIIPALGASTTIIGRRIKHAQKQIVAQSAELAGSTTETLRNVELVKSLGLEKQETERLNKTNTAILDLELQKIRLIRTLSFTQGTLVNAMRSAILFLMLMLIWRGAITLGEFFSLFIYSFFIFTPLGELGNVAAQYNEAKASMEALEGILSLKPEDKKGRKRLHDHLQSLAFERVEFSYAQQERAAIEDISFKAASGQSIAFVGPSGSGKTTIMKLVAGLFRPTSGIYRINGIPSAEIDFDTLRSRIGYVSQETQLFAGTVRENLLFVNPDATDTECLEALRSASVLGIINRGDKGLDTKIGEGGVKISGGERQRLAIARALLRHPELIIFDEATSNLDSITEKHITDTIRAISDVRERRIMILVAHRLSTVAHANTIYVLEQGRIAEQGTHATLLKKRGLYAALWREQSGERSERLSAVALAKAEERGTYSH